MQHGLLLRCISIIVFGRLIKLLVSVQSKPKEAGMAKRYGILIFLVVTLFGMDQNNTHSCTAPNPLVAKLVASQFQLGDQDILDLELYLQKEGALLAQNEKTLLDDLLFKVSQYDLGASAARVGRLLVEAGADPCAQYSIDEILILKSDIQYHKTAQSVKTDAKTEAKGLLKQYLDSLASNKH